MPKNATAEDVFLAVIERIHLQNNSARFFYLFETVEDMFGKSTMQSFFYERCNFAQID